jgi:hypothetical protein
MTKLVVKAKKQLSLAFKQMSVDTILVICAMLKERQQVSSSGTAGAAKETQSLGGIKRIHQLD